MKIEGRNDDEIGFKLNKLVLLYGIKYLIKLLKFGLHTKENCYN